VRWICRKIAVTEAINTPAEHADCFAFNCDLDWSFWLRYQPTPEAPIFSDFVDSFLNVEALNQRQLTYNRDVLDAFAGVMGGMTPYFHAGFHFGLLELTFDIALLWQPRMVLKTEKFCCRRRRSTTRLVMGRLGECVGPKHMGQRLRLDWQQVGAKGRDYAFH